MTPLHPHGFGYGNEAVTAGKITLRIAAILREHRVNALLDLPPEPFQEAAARQGRLDVLRAQQHAKLTERLVRAREKQRPARELKRAARFENFRRLVESRGGIGAVSKVALARDLGIGRATLRDYIKLMEKQAAEGGARCLACGQAVHIDRIPTIHDDDTDAATERQETPKT